MQRAAGGGVRAGHGEGAKLPRVGLPPGSSNESNQSTRYRTRLKGAVSAVGLPPIFGLRIVCVCFQRAIRHEQSWRRALAEKSRMGSGDAMDVKQQRVPRGAEQPPLFGRGLLHSYAGSGVSAGGRASDSHGSSRHYCGHGNFGRQELRREDSKRKAAKSKADATRARSHMHADGTDCLEASGPPSRGPDRATTPSLVYSRAHPSASRARMPPERASKCKLFRMLPTNKRSG